MFSLFWSEIESLLSTILESPLSAAGGVAIGSLAICKIVRWLNRRDSPRYQPPRDP